ncbi:MAG TPA: GMC family oxidoreductase [Kofleriaceae bacterium]|nr:GMC family oxidoreductase [Kofleriaceae bacterium]
MALPSTTPGVLGEASLATFDAIVIGSGAAGAVVARTFARAGLHVLILEAGDNYFPLLDDPSGLAPPLFANDEIKMDIRSMIAQDALIEPRSFRASEADGDRTLVGDVNGLPRNVGGAAVHADMKYPRFRPTDFQLGTLLGPIAGASFVDWPIDYPTLERFYVEIEQAVGVQGPEGSDADPFAAPKSKPYPMPPGLPMYANTILADAARSLGYHPFAYPTAVTSMPYRGRPACIDCGFCSGFGCPTHAKSSPAVTMLRDALLTGNVQLRFNAAVMRLVPNATLTALTAVEYMDPDGNVMQVSADRYVLAASAAESARLVLLSDPLLGNSSGLVGRNLMFHYQTTVVGVLRDRVHGHRGRSVTMGMSDFRGTPGDPGAPLGGVIELATSAELVGEAKNYALQLGVTGDKLKRLMQQSPLRDKLVAMIMQAEDAPQPTNRIDLDPALLDVYGRPAARVTYQNHVYETSTRAFYLPKMLAIQEAAGAQFGLVDPPDVPSQSRHIMGTMRFGDDPAQSVCDRFGQLHDLGNLWCADGGLFPTSSGFNPTLTIQALALWVAANIVSPGDPTAVLMES